MTDNTINADVTMVDPVSRGGSGRRHPQDFFERTINADVTMVDSAPSAGAGRLRAGDVILGRYVVESELGQGGMGVVYLCFDKTGGVRVAVKGLPPEVSHNADEMEAVRDNYRLVCGLQHPNIAGVRHLEKDAATGDYFLVMTYAHGISLKRWLRDHSGRAYRAEQLKVLRQIASALDYAHNAKPNRVIHRDIKPGNVMVDAQGNAMVLDFGLAAQVRSSLSRVSQVVTSRSGTPAYKSPEQWLAQPQYAPSDQYSLGVIAYQMFAGAIPFDSDDIEILKRAVAFDRVPKIRGERKSVNAVFAKVLAKKPQDRFASCSDFVDALEGKGAGAGASTSRMTVVVVCGLLAFVSLCAWWIWKTQRDVETELQAEAAQRQEQSRRKAEKERLAAELRRKEEARLAAEKAEAERKAREEALKAEKERLAAELRRKEEARLAAEKAEAERKAREEALKAEKERLAAELRRKEEARLAAEKAEAEARALAAAEREERRSVSLSGRSSERFTKEDADTLSLLEFPSARIREDYKTACDLARKGAYNKGRVKEAYEHGRAWGGPEWPELEAWLDWWK